MSHVPLVVAGPSVLDPDVGFETRVLDRTFDVVAACVEAAAAELAAHARRAKAVIADTIGAGRDSPPAVSVIRRTGRLCVRVPSESPGGSSGCSDQSSVWLGTRPL
jgi:hypothetical protein